MEELTTQIKGKITELNVAKYFLEKGYIISQPLVDTRYDFLLDNNGTILKIQVKTGRTNETKEYIEFNTSNAHTNTQGTTNRNYKGQIDYFATFYENQCYLIPVDECGSRNKKLRLLPTKNGQIQGISWAKDYTLEKVLK